MILEDFVMLGTTVPEPNRDGRTFVCSAGYSQEYGGLLRIYPLSMRQIPRRWGIYRVPLERPTPQHDSRHESFKIKGDRSLEHHFRINERFELASPGEVRRSGRGELLRGCWVESIQEANRRRISLALIEPRSLELYFEDGNKAATETPELRLFELGSGERVTMGSKAFPYIPRLRFIDEGGEHHLQLRDWGSYEWMRKRPDEISQLGKNLHLGQDSSLLVGNLSHRRNTWLVISVLNGVRVDSSPNLLMGL